MSEKIIFPSSESHEVDQERRSFLGIGAAALGGLFVPALMASDANAANFKGGVISKGSRRVSFQNTHTGESFSGIYRVGDKYLPEAFQQINVVMRDFRTNQVYPMDPRVIDIIYMVQRMSGQNRPYDIISGYRSPRTNNMLRNTSSGVAKKSLHMEGKAIDLRIDGFSTRRIRDLAKSLKAGGVGYYSKSDFVHVDCGDVRSW